MRRNNTPTIASQAGSPPLPPRTIENHSCTRSIQTDQILQRGQPTASVNKNTCHSRHAPCRMALVGQVSASPHNTPTLGGQRYSNHLETYFFRFECLIELREKSFQEGFHPPPSLIQIKIFHFGVGTSHHLEIFGAKASARAKCHPQTFNRIFSDVTIPPTRRKGNVFGICALPRSPQQAHCLIQKGQNVHPWRQPTLEPHHIACAWAHILTRKEESTR